MMDEDNSIQYLGQATVSSARRISLPDAIFEYGILTRSPGSVGFWSFEKLTGIKVLSNQPLDSDDFVTVDSRQVGSEQDGNRITIPHVFFSDDKGEYGQIGTVDEKAQIEIGMRFHFITNEHMIEQPVASCYLLTNNELEQRLTGDPNIGSVLRKMPTSSTGPHSQT